MDGYWLSMSVGPVQGFIAAARRTRDLWYGSWLLSEVSKAAVCELHKSGVSIVMPGVASAVDLEPGSDLIVTNKLLALVPVGMDPEGAFVRAKKAARERFLREADLVLQPIRRYVNEERWQNQIEDFLEIYGAWAPNTGIESRRLVEQLLSGRKALRDFSPGYGEARVPKSSLDGLRESVLRVSTRALSANDLRRLDLKEAEQLDAIGFIKRLGQGRQQYPSIARMAADPWLRLLSRDTTRAREFADLKEAASQCPDLALLRGSQFSHFPFDATICYPSRLEELFPGEEQRQARKRVAGILESICYKPSPYMAVLAADGDKMGAIIDSLESTEEINALSMALSRFAEDAKLIVRDNHGALVYAGGDDVLALLPLDKCLQAARELYNAFGEQTRSAVSGRQPTLSVGIAINHFMEPLTDILTRSREAEAAAKLPDRNGLAVTLHKRAGGDPLQVRWCWEEEPDGIIKEWQQLFEEKRVPAKAPYDLHRVARTYLECTERGNGDTGWVFDALRVDAQRLLKRKEIKDSQAREAAERLLFATAGTAQNFQRNVKAMLLAEHLVQISRG